MNEGFQNMNPNPKPSLDDDHSKFRARFERLATFSLGYDPSLLEASPASSTMSRSPLQPVKIRTDWSRPDLDDEVDSELNSSAKLSKFTLDDVTDSQISDFATQETSLPEPHFSDCTSLLKTVDLHSHSASSAFVLDDVNHRRDSESGLSAILTTSSENDSDMELSSSCGVIILDRSEGEIEARLHDPETADGKSTESNFGHEEASELGTCSDILDGISPEVCQPDLNFECCASATAKPQSESAGIDQPGLPDDECSASSKIRSQTENGELEIKNKDTADFLEQCQSNPLSLESEPENAIDFVNVSPVRKPVFSRSAEGTPIRVLFPESAHRVEGTPVKLASILSQSTSVSSSLNIEGTPSRRNRAIGQVLSEVPELVARLNSKHEEWTRRIEALKRISKFTTFHISSSALGEALLPLLDPLALQLQDLRSQIVKQACITIGELSVCLGFQFHTYARRLFPRLLDLLRIAKKVMSSAGDECLRRIISHSHVDAIDIIIQESVGNKSPIVRCRCLEYIILALQSWNTEQLGAYKSSIGSLFPKVCSDSTKDVRTTGKRLFNEFSRIWPDDSRLLFKAFDLKLQKSILSDFPQLECIVAFSDEEFTSTDCGILAKTPTRLSLAEVKANLRRESVSGGHTDASIIFVEKSPNHLPGSPFKASLPSSECPTTPVDSRSKPEDKFSQFALIPPRSPFLSFKFDQAHPSVQHDRERLAPALSPIPAEFLEGFPVPAPLKASVPTESCSMLPEPSPLVKHSSRRFTSRIAGTPINGKFDDFVNDEDSCSSSSSTCPTIDQSFDEADEAGQVSVSSSIAATSADVLSRDVAPFDFLDSDQTELNREDMRMLESKLLYLRTMATSVFDECESPVRTIEIHHDLTCASTLSVEQNLASENKNTPELPGQVQAVGSPPRNELKCDSTLIVGTYSFAASKSPKDVLNAVLCSPSSDHVFKSPDTSPFPTTSRINNFTIPKRPDSDDDSSILRSILFILLSLISFAILFHGLPTFLRSDPDELVSQSKISFSPSDRASELPSEPMHKVQIPIRDSAEVVFESSEESGVSGGVKTGTDEDFSNINNLVGESEISNHQSLFSEFEQPGEPISAKSKDDDEPVHVSPENEYPFADPAYPVLEQISAHPDSSERSTIMDELTEFSQHFKFEISNSEQNVSESLQSSILDDSSLSENSEALFSENDCIDELASSCTSDSQETSEHGIGLSPKLAWLYSFLVAAVCWVTYRVRAIPVRAQTLNRDPDFDLTGVTMAPEWDINLDSVLPSNPSPLPLPGGTDYQRWNHIKKDGTTMTLFSPLRRTLRIRRPRRPTQF